MRLAGKKGGSTYNKAEVAASFPSVDGDAPVRKRFQEHIVPAYVVEPPDLVLHATILNLLWYAVECINSLPGISGKNARADEHFIKCVSRLKAIAGENSSALQNAARKQLFQFLLEAEKAADMLCGSLDKATPGLPLSAGGEIAAKATYLEWLAVCISQELRLPCTGGEPRQRS